MLQISKRSGLDDGQRPATVDCDGGTDSFGGATVIGEGDSAGMVLYRSAMCTP